MPRDDADWPHLSGRGPLASDDERLPLGELAAQLGIDVAPSFAVDIDRSRLEIISGRLRDLSARAAQGRAKWDDPMFWNVEFDLKDRAQYLAVGNAINFRFWVLTNGSLWPVKGYIDSKEFRGSMYMWRCLRRCLDLHIAPVLDAQFLRHLSEEQFDAIFTDDSGKNPLDVAREERINNLRDLGEQLVADWGGQFWSLLESTGHSLVRFVQMSRRFRAYDDPLCKLSMVNAILLSGSEVFVFSQPPLPGIDYEIVKQLLRQAILLPNSQMGRKLKEFQLLSADEAYELRRTALKAMIMLSELANVPGDLLDNRYWLNRVNCTDLSPVCQRPPNQDLCPFWRACSEQVALHRPLELTRYY